jgi:hypothetical protein
VYQRHPEVIFKPGPFYMGDGFLGWGANICCISWVLFVSVIFALPTVLPVTPTNMNYASVRPRPFCTPQACVLLTGGAQAITGGVVILSLIWYAISGHNHYKGPVSNLNAPTKSLDLGSVDEKEPVSVKVSPA